MWFLVFVRYFVSLIATKNLQAHSAKKRVFVLLSPSEKAVGLKFRNKRFRVGVQVDRGIVSRCAG